jgi:hypothetical protein
MIYLITAVSAALPPSTVILNTVCGVIRGIYNPLTAIGSSLVLLMIVYAGVKYVYSADDPGGRKQAKSMIVNAIIGGIILVIAAALAQLATTGLAFCSGV